MGYIKRIYNSFFKIVFLLSNLADIGKKCYICN